MLFNTFVLGLVLGFLAGTFSFCLIGLLCGSGRQRLHRLTVYHQHDHHHGPQELHHLYPQGEVRWEPTEQDLEAECSAACSAAPMRLASAQEVEDSVKGQYAQQLISHASQQANGCCNPVQ